MLEYLILNNRLAAASCLSQISTRSYKEELLDAFNKGKRAEFLKIFLLLSKQPKLEFYLRVYFLIYSIHPSLKSRASIPEEEIVAFKEYLDSKGADLAKTNEFLEFYALPFVKKPLEHASYKALFKKEWVSNLTEKLNIFLKQEDQRLKETSNGFIGNRKFEKVGETNNERIKDMQEKNKHLFAEVEQFKQKYLSLEENHKSMIDFFNSYMMDSQSHWFQLAKELTAGSRTLIEMIIRSNSGLASERKFLRIKRKIERYEKMLQKELDELMNQSQDISLFEKHSINEISYTGSIVPSYSHRNIPLLQIDQFMPINYAGIMQDLKRGLLAQKKEILQGLTWRIIKSKSKTVRKQNIVGLFLNDTLGILTGDASQLLKDKPIRFYLLELISFISQDSYGKKVLFRNGRFYKQIVELVPQVVGNRDYDSLSKIIFTVEQIVHIRELVPELIELGLISTYLRLLTDDNVLSNIDMLENMLAALLSIISREEGLDACEKDDCKIFTILCNVFMVKNTVIHTLIGGIMYLLINRYSMYQRAHEEKLDQFIEYLQGNDDKANHKQLKLIRDKLAKFNGGHVICKEEDAEADESVDSNLEEDLFDDFEDDLVQIDQYIKGSEIISSRYSMQPKEAAKQVDDIGKIMQQLKKTKERLLGKKGSKKDVKEQEEKLLKLPDIRSKGQTEQVRSRNIERVKSSEQEPNIFKSPSFKNVNFEHKNSKNSDYLLQNISLDRLASPIKPQGKVNNFAQVNDKMGQKSNREVVQSSTQVPGEPRKKEKHEYRIKKSSSVEKNLGLKKKTEDSYQTRKNESMVNDNKVNDEKNKPPQKPRRTREEVLKQLNEELRANANRAGKRIKQGGLDEQHQQSVPPQNYQSQKVRENIHMKSHSSPTDELVAPFASRPKLKRTPPKDE